MLILERPWTRQPPYNTGLNRSHPLAAAALEYTRIDAAGIETLAGYRSVNLGTAAVVPAVGRSGIGRSAATQSATQYEQAALSLSSWPSAFTLYARISPGSLTGDPGANTSTARYFYSIWLNNGNQAVGFGCAGNGQINAVCNIGANRINTTITGTASVEYDAFISHPGGNAGFTLEVLGLGSNTTSTTTPTPTLASHWVQIGANLSTSSPGHKTTFYGGLFKGVLTATERQMLANNPAALFAPSRIYIPTSTAAATVPTLSASTYVTGSLTSTGWRPQITAS